VEEVAPAADCAEYADGLNVESAGLHVVAGEPCLCPTQPGVKDNLHSEKNMIYVGDWCQVRQKDRIS